MPNDITQQRQAAYNRAPAAIQEIYGDIALGDVIDSWISALHIDTSRQPVFIHIIGDTLLGLILRRNFKQALVSGLGISIVDAEKIESAIIPFFSRAESEPPLPEINPDTREKLELRPQGMPHMPTAAPVEDPGARPLTREEVLRTLAPKRTLASDIESLRQQGAAAEGYTTPQQTEDKE